MRCLVAGEARLGPAGPLLLPLHHMLRPAVLRGCAARSRSPAHHLWFAPQLQQQQRSRQLPQPPGASAAQLLGVAQPAETPALLGRHCNWLLLLLLVLPLLLLTAKQAALQQHLPSVRPKLPLLLLPLLLPLPSGLCWCSPGRLCPGAAVCADASLGPAQQIAGPQPQTLPLCPCLLPVDACLTGPTCCCVLLARLVRREQGC